MKLSVSAIFLLLAACSNTPAFQPARKPYILLSPGSACPTRIGPDIPIRAFIENVSGVVTAQARVRKGVVQEVTILSGPTVFHEAVADAMKQYKCNSSDEDYLIKQEFEFNVQTVLPPAKAPPASK